jgi:hypothetical protein
MTRFSSSERIFLRTTLVKVICVKKNHPIIFSWNKNFKPFYFFNTEIPSPEFYKYLGFNWCVDLKLFKKECIKELLKKAKFKVSTIVKHPVSLPNLSNSALYSAEVNLVNLHDYRFKKVIVFRLNTEDPILNEQLKSFNSTTSKVKKGKIAKNITSYDSLYQACWKAHHEYLITHALSKPEKHPDSLNLQDKIEKKMLSDWSARRQRFYISEVNNATYSTRKNIFKEEYTPVLSQPPFKL